MAGLPASLPAILGGETSLTLPSLDGLVWGEREEVWKSSVEEALSSKETRTSWWLGPRTVYRLSYNFLRAGSPYEFQAVSGFFSRMGGRLNSFRITDPEDYTVTAHPFGVGDGSATQFQLQRTLVPSASLNAAASRTYWPYVGDGYRPVYDLNATPQIYINDVLKTETTHYTVSAYGVVTFVSAPAADAVLTWTGTYYWRVRFNHEGLALSQIVSALHQGKKVELITVKP